MRQEHAEQIAGLLNRRNRLTTRFDARTILQRETDFLFELEGDEVVGCLEIRKVQ